MMDALTWNGGMWGIPLDIHANLMHTNMDAMSAAGLVKNGKPVYPTSSDEMLQHAKACNDAGYEYMAFQMADGFLELEPYMHLCGNKDQIYLMVKNLWLILPKLEMQLMLLNNSLMLVTLIQVMGMEMHKKCGWMAELAYLLMEHGLLITMVIM